MGEFREYDAKDELRYLDQPKRDGPGWSTVLLTGVILGLPLIGLGLWVVKAEAQELKEEQAPVEWNITDLAAISEAVARGEISDSGEVEKQEGLGVRLAAIMSRIGANPGVGFNLAFGTQATYDCGSAPREARTINPSARPWGGTGNGSEDGAAFSARYWESRRNTTCWPAGFSAELFPVNKEALDNWSATGCYPLPLQSVGLDGISTIEEQYDLAVTVGTRRHEVYRLCWWERLQGGSRANPIPRDMAWVTGGSGLTCRQVEGDLWTCDSVWGWPLWARVAGSPPPPAPPPPPVPPPPPTTPSCPPARLENCTNLKSPFGQSVCAGCPCPESMPPREKEYHCIPSSPPPPPTCEECAAGGYRDSRCSACPCPPELVDSSGHVHALPGHFCRPVTPPVRTCIEYSATLYVPTIESTGRLELVLVPQGEAPCP